MNLQKLLIGLFTLFSILLYQNCAPIHKAGSLDGNSTNQSILGDGAIDPVQSLSAFEKTLYPLLQTNCVQCHGVSQQPLFAVNNSSRSYDTLIGSGLVNLPTPSASRIVVKIKGQHQSFPISLGAELETAIISWAAAIQQTSGGSGGGNGIPLPSPPVLEAKFSSINALILIPKCLSCHSPGGRRPSEDYSSYSTTISTGKVRPGNPTGSAMYTECANGSMPDMAPNLSANEISALRTWIADGALDN